MKKRKAQASETPLTDDELNMLKRSVESEDVDRSTLPHYDNSDKARFFRFLKKDRLFTAVCIILVVLAVALLAICAVIAVNIAKNRPNTDDFTIILGDEEYTVKYKDVMRDDLLYIDMYKVANYTGLTKSGTNTNIKFTADEDNYLRFENDSSTAVINGSLVEMGGAAKVNKNVCEVPLTFLQKAVGTEKTSALKISLDQNTNTLTIKRRVYKTNKKDVAIPVEMLFYSDSFNVIQAIVRPNEEQKNYQYLLDVNSIMSSIDPTDAEAKGYLVLANKQTPLGSSYEPNDLEFIPANTNGKAIKLRHDAQIAVSAMMREMSVALGKEDHYVTSAYRPYSYQQSLFEGYIKDHMENDGMTREEAEAAALEYSARPGTSEHQSGLCVDITNVSDMSGKLEESFENTEAYKWLSENAHRFGFILRYPKDKVDITGYTYEPWHYRFVGRTAAAEIYASGLCLEEYLALN